MASLEEDGILVIPCPFPLPEISDKRFSSGWCNSAKRFKRETRIEPGAPLFTLAKNQTLLDLVSAYQGAADKIDVTLVGTYPSSEREYGSQLWHRDTHGAPRCIRAFTYLCDVDMGNGPLCYVPGSQLGGRNDLGVTERLPDDEFERLIPRDKWVTYTAPKGTTILFDVLGYHKGLRNLSGIRKVLCFTYARR